MKDRARCSEKYCMDVYPELQTILITGSITWNEEVREVSFLSNVSFIMNGIETTTLNPLEYILRESGKWSRTKPFVWDI